MSQSLLVSMSSTQIASISRLFSASVFIDIASNGKSAIFSRLLRDSGLCNNLTPDSTVRDIFEAALASLKSQSARPEYIYKAAITQKVLLGRHSLNTACMLTEFRAARCKADVVLLNGTSTAYEIKSEKDNLDRLPTQLAAYRQVFARVYVLAGAKHIPSLLSSIPKDVGIIELNRRNQLSTIRETNEDLSRLDVGTIFDSLRLIESSQILTKNGFEIPDVPNGELYRTLREMFISLDSTTAHDCMVTTLKENRSHQSLSNFVDKIPPSMKTLALSVLLNRRDRERLLDAINTPLQTVLNWS